jgi:hypothetical protein
LKAFIRELAREAEIAHGEVLDERRAKEAAEWEARRATLLPEA